MQGFEWEVYSEQIVAGSFLYFSPSFAFYEFISKGYN